jgi:transposase-like protein
MDAIHRCFELGESIKSVSEAIGYTRVSIYSWRKKYLQGGTAALMNGKNIKPDTLAEGKTESTPELEQLQAQMRDMQLEIDILKETINVLKKDPGTGRYLLIDRCNVCNL